MKSTNRIVSILSIIIIISTFSFLPSIATDFFEKTIVINRIIIYTLLGITNLIVGIKNLKCNNKKNGIASIVIAILILATNIFKILSYITMYDIYGTINGIAKILAIALLVYSLIVNRKNENEKISGTIKILISIVVLTEIILFTVIIVFTRINIKNIEKAVKILSEEEKKQIIAYECINNNEINLDFYNNNGQLINSENYKLVSNNKYILNGKKEFTVLIVMDNNKLWIVNSEGKKIVRLYSLLEKMKHGYLYDLACTRAIKSMNCEYQRKTIEVKYYLQLKKTNDNNYLFGDFSMDGYQLEVDLNRNELDENRKIKKSFADKMKYFSYNNSEEQNKLLEDLYKYKKTYYFISENGEKKKVDCGSIFFTTDNNGKIAVWTYSNGSIPFYDDKESGYIELNGQISKVPSTYIVYDVKDKYKIVYSYANGGYYILSNDNIPLINEIPKDIGFYNDNYLVTDEYVYIIKNNKFIKMSDKKISDKYISDKVVFINISDNIFNYLPYEISVPFDYYSLYLNID